MKDFASTYHSTESSEEQLQVGHTWLSRHLKEKLTKDPLCSAIRAHSLGVWQFLPICKQTFMERWTFKSCLVC